MAVYGWHSKNFLFKLFATILVVMKWHWSARLSQSMSRIMSLLSYNIIIFKVCTNKLQDYRAEIKFMRQTEKYAMMYYESNGNMELETEPISK
jgi:hypothetical protein